MNLIFLVIQLTSSPIPHLMRTSFLLPSMSVSNGTGQPVLLENLITNIFALLIILNRLFKLNILISVEYPDYIHDPCTPQNIVITSDSSDISFSTLALHFVGHYALPYWYKLFVTSVLVFSVTHFHASCICHWSSFLPSRLSLCPVCHFILGLRKNELLYLL
jgi:hypothetical protein